VFVTDSTKGAETVYFTGTKEASIYQGVAGFVFTTSNDADSIFLQGCYNTSAWYDIDTVAPIGTAAVNRELYHAPPRYKYYRLKAVGITGDTCIISNTRYYLKY
jgi:hypothetical protein